MSNSEHRPKRSARSPVPLRRALAATRGDRNERQADDVTKRLDAVYAAEPEDSAMDPLLTELQSRSLRSKW